MSDDFTARLDFDTARHISNLFFSEIDKLDSERNFHENLDQIIDPKLKPAEIIRLITEGSDVSTEDAKIRLINARRTLGLVKK